jgi:hypothetical protein
MAFHGRGTNGEILQIINGRPVYSPLDLTASGFVVGPASSTDDALAKYDGTTGKLVQNSNAILSDAGDLTLTGDLFASDIAVSGTIFVPEGRLLPLTVQEADGSPLNANTQNLIFPNASIVSSGNTVQVVFPADSGGTIVGPGSSTDNALVRWDGTAGVVIQNSNAILTDAGDLTLAGDVTAERVIQPQVTTTASYQEIADTQYAVLASGTDTLILPPSPLVGQTHVVKDISGAASTNNITVFASGSNVDGGASTTLVNDYESLTFIWNGAEWSII